MKTTYQIRSIKHSEEFTGTLDMAIARAADINAEYQPAYGVQVEDAGGETQWDSEEETTEYHVIRCQDGVAPIYCGTRDSLPSARTLASSGPPGIGEAVWSESREAPICGLRAPVLDPDAPAVEWCGKDGTWGIFCG